MLETNRLLVPTLARSRACATLGRRPPAGAVIQMPKVTIQPLGVVLEVPAGATIMGAVQAQGYYWPTTCGGEGRCTTCACVVLSGMDHLSPRGRSESRVLADERGPRVLEQPVRLACQAQAYGDVELEKPGVRPPSGLRASALSAGEPGE